MSVLDKLKALENSIAGFFSNAHKLSNDLEELKTVLGVASEVAAVVDQASGISQAVNVADTLITDVQGVIPNSNNPTST